MTVGLQAFSATYSRAGSGTLTQTAALLAMLLPVAIFFVAQRAFMRGVVISGVEK
jgi:multiple sugar transport system permease protein